MAESVNKKLLSALTEGHEKELRSSARRTSKTSNKSTGSTAKSSKTQKNTVSDSSNKRKYFLFS